MLRPRLNSSIKISTIIILGMVGVSLLWYPVDKTKPPIFQECIDEGGIPISGGHPAVDKLYKCVILDHVF